MLSLRYLHSTKARKSKELQVCNIVATFNFNGLKFYHSGHKRKSDSCILICGSSDGHELCKKVKLDDYAARLSTVAPPLKKSDDNQKGIFNSVMLHQGGLVKGKS